RMIAQGAVPADRIVVVPNGIDTQRFYPDPAWRAATRAALGIAPGQRLVLHVGRLVPEKNQRLLLDAFARVAQGSDAQLRIAGDGPLRAELAQRIAALGLGRHARLLGTRADVPWLLNAADLFVLSSEIE
ncbi:glycosyltransferase, partial [Klebsiella pneumoniae]|uniref:glycosyltransferase n=1 Tax=Klebsiella pneumoniae TaxID=573 RepID=UPI001BD08A43